MTGVLEHHWRTSSTRSSAGCTFSCCTPVHSLRLQVLVLAPGRWAPVSGSFFVTPAKPTSSHPAAASSQQHRPQGNSQLADASWSMPAASSSPTQAPSHSQSPLLIDSHTTSPHLTSPLHTFRHTTTSPHLTSPTPPPPPLSPPPPLLSYPPLDIFSSPPAPASLPFYPPPLATLDTGCPRAVRYRADPGRCAFAFLDHTSLPVYSTDT